MDAHRHGSNSIDRNIRARGVRAERTNKVMAPDRPDEKLELEPDVSFVLGTLNQVKRTVHQLVLASVRKRRCEDASGDAAAQSRYIAFCPRNDQNRIRGSSRPESDQSRDRGRPPESRQNASPEPDIARSSPVQIIARSLPRPNKMPVSMPDESQVRTYHTWTVPGKSQLRAIKPVEAR